MRKLFKIHIYENKNFMFIMLTIATIMTVILTLGYASGGGYRAYSYGFSMLTLFLSFLIFPLMINSFSFNKRKAEVDFYYTLATTKRKLVTSKIIYDLILYTCLALVILVSYILTLLVAIYDISTVPFGKIFLYYLICYTVIILVYMFMLPFFYYGNSVLDGLIYMVMIIAILFLVSGNITYLINQEVEHLFPRKSFNLYPYFLINYFSDEMEWALRNNFTLKIEWNSGMIISFILPLISFVSFLLTLSLDKNERTGQISNSLFGYQTFIPLLMLNTAFYLGFVDKFSVIGILLLAVLHFILVLISQKGFKLTKKTLTTLGVELAVVILVYITTANIVFK